MRTISTDRYGLLPWIWAFLTLWFGYLAWAEANGLRAGLFLLGAIWWSVLLIREIVRRRAESSFEDPSITKAGVE